MMFCAGGWGKLEKSAGGAPATEGERAKMTQLPVGAFQRLFGTVTLAAAIMLTAASMASAQQVVAFVNGEPITELDVAHRTKFGEMSTHQTPSRQEVLDGLINEILEIREAKRYTIEPSDSDVNTAYADIATKMGVDPPKLTQILVAGGASEATLKHRLRAQIAWASLVRGRFRASLEIPDSDVEVQLQLHKPADKDQLGYEYIVRPIILVVPHGSPDAVFEARKRDADALRVRFQSCADGIPFARALREVAVRDPVSKSSADLQQDLRDILDKTEVGHLTPPEQTAEGVQMFAVCSKKETKSDTPGLREVRDEMFQQKFGAKAKRYLEELRREAMIEYK